MEEERGFTPTLTQKLMRLEIFKKQGFKTRKKPDRQLEVFNDYISKEGIGK